MTFELGPRTPQDEDHRRRALEEAEEAREFEAQEVERADETGPAGWMVSMWRFEPNG